MIRTTAAAILLLATPAAADTVTIRGTVDRVIDGDTIEMQGHRLRLVGLDAPEGDQPYGDAATAALAAFVRDAVECSWAEIDRYGRPLAVCARILASGRASKVSVNKEMVRRGHAAAGLPWGYELERQQSLAMKDCLGMWADAMLPWCWRRN